MHGLQRTARSPDYYSRRYKRVRAGVLEVYLSCRRGLNSRRSCDRHGGDKSSHVPLPYFSVHFTGTRSRGAVEAALNFWFPTRRLLLSAYVDDLTLLVLRNSIRHFGHSLHSWSTLKHRSLSIRHYVINAPAESTENAALRALEGAVALDMVDYAQQTVDDTLQHPSAQRDLSSLATRM